MTAGEGGGRLGEFTERELLAWLRERFGDGPAGVGDDAAVLAWRGPLVISTDAMVEGVHFERGWLTPRDIGRRATAACLSDVAAMGGLAVAVLLSLGVPKGLGMQGVQELISGCAEKAGEFGARLVGGDTTASDELFVDTVALGALEGEPWLRSGAEPGDVVAVTGQLGEAAAALAALKAGGPELARRLGVFERFADPVPRLREAEALRRGGVPVKAAIDISDGLLMDAGRMAAASGVRIAIRADALPVSEAAERAAAELGLDALELAAAGGEEFELLLAIGEEDVEKAAACVAQAGGRLVVIGRVEEGWGAAIVDESGREMDLGGGGYDHFAGR